MADLVPRAQLADNVEPFDRGAEHGVAGIKIMLRAKAEVELRPSGIRMLGARHGERMSQHQDEILKPMRAAGNTARDNYYAHVSEWEPEEK